MGCWASTTKRMTTTDQIFQAAAFSPELPTAPKWFAMDTEGVATCLAGWRDGRLPVSCAFGIGRSYGTCPDPAAVGPLARIDTHQALV